VDRSNFDTFVTYSLELGENGEVSMSIDDETIASVVDNSIHEGSLLIGSSERQWVVDEVSVNEYPNKYDIDISGSEVLSVCSNTDSSYKCCDLAGLQDPPNFFKTTNVKLLNGHQVFAISNVFVSSHLASGNFAYFNNGIAEEIQVSGRGGDISISYLKLRKEHVGDIQHATLSLYKSGGVGTGELQVSTTSCDWDESKTTYNNRPTCNEVIGQTNIPPFSNVVLKMMLDVEHLQSHLKKHNGNVCVCLTTDNPSVRASFHSTSGSIPPSLFIEIKSLVNEWPRWVTQATAPSGQGPSVLEKSIELSSGIGVFDIDKLTGVVSLMKPVLNFELQNTYVLSVIVVDNGTPKLRSRSNVIIHVTDINEAPVLKASVVTIPENSPVGTPVSELLVATDVDVDQVLTYDLVSNPWEIFRIEACNGKITLQKEVLNFEAKSTYFVIARVHDSGFSGVDSLFDTAEITIRVLDVNEQPTIYWPAN
jgi:hypothetical protein